MKLTREEYERLPEPSRPDHERVEWSPPLFTTKEEINFNTARRIRYRRARLWVREDEYGSDKEREPTKYINIHLTLEREIIRQYPVDALFGMLKRELIEAFLASMDAP